MNQRGICFGVDLEYPNDIHTNYEDLPMEPKRYKVKYDQLSLPNEK